MFLSIAYLFLLIHNTLVQTYVSKIHRHPPCFSSSEKDRRSVEPFLWGGKNRGRDRASDLRKRALDLMGKEEDRGSPFFPSNPSASTTTAPPQRQRGSVAGAARTQVKTSSSKRVSPPPGSEAYAVEATHNAGSRLPREPTLHASLPFRPSQKLCVSRSWYSVGREEHTVCNVIYFHPYLPLICLLPSLFLPFISLPFLFPIFLWQTIVGDSQNIYVTDTHRELCWMTKADAGCTSRAFKHPGHDVTRTWRLAINFDWLHIWFRAGQRWWRSP